MFLLKLAYITPQFIKKIKSQKDNYRPLSILSNISEVYEELMIAQISVYYESILSKYQCEFRNGFSVQQCLLSMLEKSKYAPDNKKVFVSFLTAFRRKFYLGFPKGPY